MTDSTPDGPDAHPDTRGEVETVRCIIQRPDGAILLLRKSSDSKAASLLEFPGGKIDAASRRPSSLAEQRDAAVQEVLEETGIDIASLPLRKIDEYSYSFEHGDRVYRRRVHAFRVVVPADEPDVTVGGKLDAAGRPEDKHAGFRWVSIEELVALRDDGRLSGNSRRFPDVLDAGSG